MRKIWMVVIPMVMLMSVSFRALSHDAEAEVITSAEAKEPQAEIDSRATVLSLPARFFGWSALGLFAGSSFGGYLRRRPTAWTVVAIWYYAVFQIYSSLQLGISIVPPALAIIISIVLAPVAKAADDLAVSEGRRREEPHRFSSGSTLTMAFNYITVGLVASMWLGWDAWNVFPGFHDQSTSWKLTVGTMLFTGVPLMMWIDTVAHGGLRVFRSIPIMAVLFLRCRRGRFLLSTAVFCIAFWHSPFATELQPMRWEMTVSLLVVIGALWLQPPFVLLLGASSQETGQALGRLANASFPFRVVALLDRSRTGTQFSSFSWLTDDLRTVDEREWRWVVDNLIEVIPIIVLDARTTRPVVVEEARQLLRHDIRLKRSTFVIGADCLAPALVLNGVSSSFSGIRVINEGQIGNVLSFTTLSAPSSPTAPHEPS